GGGCHKRRGPAVTLSQPARVLRPTTRKIKLALRLNRAKRQQTSGNMNEFHFRTARERTRFDNCGISVVEMSARGHRNSYSNPSTVVEVGNSGVSRLCKFSSSSTDSCPTPEIDLNQIYDLSSNSVPQSCKLLPSASQPSRERRIS